MLFASKFKDVFDLGGTFLYVLVMLSLRTLTHTLANPFRQTLQRHSFNGYQSIFREATNFKKFSTKIQLKSAAVA